MASNDYISELTGHPPEVDIVARECCSPPRSSLASIEVPTRMAILYKSARHSRHKNVDDLPHSKEAVKLGSDPFTSFKDGASSVV